MKRFFIIVLIAAMLTAFVPVLPMQAAEGLCSENAPEIQNECLGLGSYEISNSISYVKPFDGNYYISAQDCNWAHSDYAYYNADKNGNLVVVVAEHTAYAVFDDGKAKEWGIRFEKRLNVYTYDEEYGLVAKETVQLPDEFDIWGGFFFGEDGFFYAAVGRENPDENDNKTVIRVIRYSQDWTTSVCCDIKAGAENVYKGITTPFACGRGDFAAYGKTLIFHTSRKMYETNGSKHETDITFFIDTETMKTVEGCEMPYASHSFNQFVLNDGKELYFVDHGDAYPRGIAVGKYKIKDNGGKLIGCECESERTVMKFDGEPRLNYTGTCVGGAEQNDRYLFIAGSSSDYVPDGFFEGTRPYRKNVFLIRVDKKDLSYTKQWLTDYPLEGNTTASSPRLVKVGDDCFAILYNVHEESGNSLHCVYFNGKGETIRTEECDGVFFADNSDPVVFNNNIIWVSPLKSELHTSENLFYTVNYADPDTEYTLTYYLNDEIYASQKYRCGETITPPDDPVPEHEDEDFTGWEGLMSKMPARDLDVYGRTVKFMLGDCNNDETVNTADAVLVLKYSAGMQSLSDLQAQKANVKRDDKVNTADAVLILKYAAGMISEF